MEGQKVEIKKQVHDVVFSCEYAKELLSNGDVEGAKNYIKKFFLKHNGEGVFYFDSINSTYELTPNEKLKNVIAKDITKLNHEKKKALEFSAIEYLQSSEFLKYRYNPTINFNKDKLFTEEIVIDDVNVTKHMINMKKPRPCINYNESVPRESIQDKLDIVYFHLKNVLCSKNVEQYEFFLNFIACTFGGRKLRKCVYIQSTERLGKGQVMNGLLKRLFGKQMYKTNSVETIVHYTKPFEGCLLLNFDELPVDSGNYKSIADAMKILITEPDFNCRTMHAVAYTQVNSFNIIVTCNNDAVSLTQTNNTKYVCLDVDESYFGKHDYYIKLADAIDNEHVRIAFYNDMMKLFKTLDNWNEDRSMPVSEMLKMKIIEALPLFIKFMKDRFILRNENLDMKTEKFFSWYYTESKDKTSKQKIGRHLKKMGIEPKKVKKGDVQYYKYEATSEQLLEQYKKNNWMDDVTDKISSKKELPSIFNSASIDKGVDKAEQSVDIKMEYEAQIKRMEEQHKKEMDLLKMQLSSKQMSECSTQLQDLSILLRAKTIKPESKPKTKKALPFETIPASKAEQMSEKTALKHNKAFDLMKQTKQKEPIDESAQVFNEAFSDFADGLLNV